MTTPLPEMISDVEVEGWTEIEGAWYDPKYLEWLASVRERGLTYEQYLASLKPLRAWLTWDILRGSRWFGSLGLVAGSS